MTSGSFISLIATLEQACHGESLELEKLAEQLRCKDKSDPGIAAIRFWRELFEEIPLDRRSFNDIYALRQDSAKPPAPAQMDDVLGWLSWWCTTFDAEPESVKKEYYPLYGLLAFLLITMQAVLESDYRLGSDRGDNADIHDLAATSQHKCDQICGKYCTNQAVKDVIRLLYKPGEVFSVHRKAILKKRAPEWESLDFGTLTFHRHGTTSIIMRIEDNNGASCALKLILLPFLRFRTIGTETLAYGQKYHPRGGRGDPEARQRDSDIRIVRVIASSRSWILMRFVEGLTLAELISRPTLIDEHLKRNAPKPGTNLPHNDVTFSTILRDHLDGYSINELSALGLSITQYKDLSYQGIDRLVKAYDLVAKHSAENDKSQQVNVNDTLDDSISLSLDWMHAIGGALLGAMKDLSRFEISEDKPEITSGSSYIHGDLTPSNIIVGDSATFELTLIDLGRNYFYTQSIAGSGAHDAIFVAPEIKANKGPFNLADIYSVGQILQYIASRGVLPTQVAFDGFYSRTPLIARFLEDLIQEQPENRLKIYPPVMDKDGIKYDQLQEIFQQEVEAVQFADKLGRGVAGDDWRDVRRQVMHPLDGALGRQRRLYKNRSGDLHYKDPEIGGYSRRLFWYDFIAALAVSITMAAVLTWFVRDLHWSWTDRWIEGLQKLTGAKGDYFPGIDSWRAADYHTPDLKDNWPAWVVGFSYMLVEAKLYQGLLSGLMPLQGPKTGKLHRQAISAEVAMRIHTVAAPILVMSVVLFQARWWPIATAIGQTVAALCNVGIYSYAKKAIDGARSHNVSTAGSRGTRIAGIQLLRQWVPSAYFYAIIVWAIAILIYVHVLHDVGMYAVAVGAINIGLFYVVKCSLAGPSIRVGMARACLAAERLRVRAELPASLSHHDTSPGAGSESHLDTVPTPRGATAVELDGTVAQ